MNTKRKVRGASPPEKAAPAEKKDSSRQKSIEKLKESLLERRMYLRTVLAGEDVSPWNEDSFIYGDAADVALGISRDELDFKRVEAISDELAQIERSIERIEEKSYGLCETCGGMIPFARLRALPFAEKCVVCQQAEDEHRRSFPDANDWTTYAGESSGIGTGFF